MSTIRLVPQLAAVEGDHVWMTWSCAAVLVRIAAFGRDSRQPSLTEVPLRRIGLTITRALRYVLGPAALIMLGGCATLTIVPAERLEEQRLTPTAQPVAHIYAANWGVYLFKYLPLITGSLSRPGVPSWPALFSDEVRVDLLVQKVSAESRQRGVP
jgi:uncharacterized protein involved in response to NO